jgi:hypothetical protein
MRLWRSLLAANLVIGLALLLTGCGENTPAGTYSGPPPKEQELKAKKGSGSKPMPLPPGAPNKKAVEPPKDD